MGINHTNMLFISAIAIKIALSQFNLQTRYNQKYQT